MSCEILSSVFARSLLLTMCLRCCPSRSVDVLSSNVPCCAALWHLSSTRVSHKKAGTRHTDGWWIKVRLQSGAYLLSRGSGRKVESRIEVSWCLLLFLSLFFVVFFAV
jgi:hypothetical protein